MAQIEKLIQIHSPDDVVAQEIRSRGLNFIPTPKILEELQQRGTGQATLTAIRERMPVGTLEIEASPGSTIAVDGEDRGTTDAQGRLTLANLPAGNHQLSVNKAGYRPGDFNLALAPSEYKRFSAQLDWAGGYLTVRLYPPGAAVEISGLGRFSNGVSDLQCSPGTYGMTVTSPGMKLETRSISVGAGEHAAIEIRLTADPEYVRNRLADAKQQLARGDTQGSIQISRALLSLEPSNPDVQSTLAAAYWRARDPGHFESAATTAVREGGAVTLDLAHEHLDLQGEVIHPATLMLSGKSISYDPGTANCKYRAFTAPLGNVEMIEVTNKTIGGFMVVRHLMPGTFLLHLDFRDPIKSDKKMTLYFATSDSRVERQSDNIGYLASQINSEQILNAVANVLRAAENLREHQ